MHGHDVNIKCSDLLDATQLDIVDDERLEELKEQVRKERALCEQV